jgi:hypothetical protein
MNPGRSLRELSIGEQKGEWIGVSLRGINNVI